MGNGTIAVAIEKVQLQWPEELYHICIPVFDRKLIQPTHKSDQVLNVLMVGQTVVALVNRRAVFGAAAR